MLDYFLFIDLADAVTLLICACDEGIAGDFGDGVLSLEEWTGPLCQSVNNWSSHLLGYDPNEEDFNTADTDGNGYVDFQEIAEYVMVHVPPMRSLNREFYFSNDANVEARVRMIGCACDKDWDFKLTMDELNADECVMTQYQVLPIGNQLDEGDFELLDANNDGFIDGEEAASALEEADKKAAIEFAKHYVNLNVREDEE